MQVPGAVGQAIVGLGLPGSLGGTVRHRVGRLIEVPAVDEPRGRVGLEPREGDRVLRRPGVRVWVRRAVDQRRGRRALRLRGGRRRGHPRKVAGSAVARHVVVEHEVLLRHIVIPGGRHQVQVGAVLVVRTVIVRLVREGLDGARVVSLAVPADRPGKTSLEARAERGFDADTSSLGLETHTDGGPKGAFPGRASPRGGVHVPVLGGGAAVHCLFITPCDWDVARPQVALTPIPLQLASSLLRGVVLVGDHETRVVARNLADALREIRHLPCLPDLHLGHGEVVLGRVSALELDADEAADLLHPHPGRRPSLPGEDGRFPPVRIASIDSAATGIGGGVVHLHRVVLEPVGIRIGAVPDVD